MASKYYSLLIIFIFLFFINSIFFSNGVIIPNDFFYSQQYNTTNDKNNDPWMMLPNELKDIQFHIEPQDGLKDKDKIHKLPGQPNTVDFNHYSGYVTVDLTVQKALFYNMVESPKDSSTKPLVLWLNGGPGCSSIGNGAFLELGPFRVKSDGKTLFANPRSWHNVANILFLDSPAPVGFSYGDIDFIVNHTGDISTTKDSYIFLVNWLERFPEYKNREFYITGESYAGHYAPQLAYSILYYNKDTKNPFINLKGLAIGNAWVDDEINWSGLYDNLLNRELCTYEAHANLYKSCNFSQFLVSLQTREECNNCVRKIRQEFGLIDTFNIYGPHECHRPTYKVSIDMVDSYDPCSVRYVEHYFQRKSVLKAIHATHAKTTDFSLCRLFTNWQDRPPSVLPLIQQLIASNNIRVWLFSGDVDGYVPPLSTKNAIKKLELPVKTPWCPWYCDDTQVGGYVVEYDGLTFVQIRGAGHAVPTFQPKRALTMISSFLQGTLPPLHVS